ncbi:hypothetical protein CROQUDRAFT_53370 [Cronartium quercuum f. sp. fusiforme G11]|uniref:DUF7872 domain-containing protein n=1 Tax=Cronartium quercuum f. sp. fusiforme G11 TaxID=708437 RepID=A0A9P6N7F0_9BASI|nr:hypothetical protein CROQUDRAFT_53370 [Cronartium quercuum f. sp. fusiforme G11]
MYARKALLLSLLTAHCSFLNGLPNLSNAGRENSDSLTNSNNLPKTNTSPLSKSQPRLQLPVEDDIDHCLKARLSPKLWRKMDMDNYLRHYPGGQNLTLSAFAETVGATNFQCGIGNPCNPSQFCAGVEGRDWYALAAAHRWNTFNNQLYEATSYSIAYVSDLTPTMVDDLIPEPSSFWTCAAVYVGVVTASVAGTPSIVWGFGVMRILWIMAIGSLFFASGVVWVMANLEVPDPQKFTRWSEVLFALQDFQSHMQAALTQYSQGIMNAGISADEGLYGIAKDGTLFNDIEMRPESEIQDKLDLNLKLRILCHILKIQKAFITRGSEPCNGDGPAGARLGSNQMSYCDESGIMMNIVLVGDKDKEALLYNAAMIQSKYGLTTEFLTMAAWKCQEKFGGFEHPSVVNSKNPYDTDSDCLFDLPVCNFMDPG